MHILIIINNDKLLINISYLLYLWSQVSEKILYISFSSKSILAVSAKELANKLDKFIGSLGINIKTDIINVKIAKLIDK